MDLIDRQAAINALGERPYLWTGGDYELGCANQYDSDKLAIETVPSAHPEMDEWCTDCKEYDSERHCCPRFGRVIRHTLDEVAPRWIPVTERLPEEDKNVLVSVHFLGLDQRHKTGWNDHIKENWYVDIASHIDGNWTSYSDEYKVAKSRHIITAWMPLPEPWKGEDND